MLDGILCCMIAFIEFHKSSDQRNRSSCYNEYDSLNTEAIRKFSSQSDK